MTVIFPPTDPRLIQVAAALAGYAHGSVGQKRKYTNEPYIVHPMEVAEIVASVTNDSQMIAAAWLHDVVEDTPFKPWEIEAWFRDLGFSGDVATNVRYLVYELTEQSKPEDGNRAARKRIDREFLAKSTPEAATIKLADLISNTSTICEYDPGFARVYMQEKRDLLEVLRHGNADLWSRANGIVEAYFSDEA